MMTTNKTASLALTAANYVTITQATYDHMKAENAQLRAFVEEVCHSAPVGEPPIKITEDWNPYAHIFWKLGRKAAALLASLDAERE